MSYCVVWIAHDHAKIFNFLPGKVDKTEFEKHGAHHHTGHHDSEDRNQTQKLYQDVSSALQNASEILIVGSGTARNEFKHFIDKHNQKLVSKIVGVEAMDKATDKEIEMKARKVFTKANLFL